MQSLNPHSCLGWARSWRTSTMNGGKVSIFSSNLPIPRLPAARRSRRLLISSSQGRRPKRRNPLRQKLLPTRDQESRIPNFSAPELHSEKDESMLDQSNHERIGEDRGGESELWNKLEKWVNRHRRDSEIWGVGSGAIFTIYKDSNGSVVRVSVDKNEILRRNQCTIMSSKSKEEKEDLHAKISHAKLIAKEIESGEYKLPENSTIAKIVMEGMPYSSSLTSIGKLHFLKPGVKELVAITPRTFLPVFFSFFFIWSVKRILFTNDRREITPQEKEMIRRKLKSWKERATSEHGTVEVISEVPELHAGSEKRPSLDKHELMKNIRSKMAPESHVHEAIKMIEQVDELEKEEHQQIESNPLLIKFSVADQLPGLDSDKTSDDERGVQLEAAHSDHGPSIEKKLTMTKPRIIVSLGDARNYLSTKSLSMDRAHADTCSLKELDNVKAREESRFLNGSSMDDGKTEIENNNSVNGSHPSSIGESSNEIDDHCKELQEFFGNQDSGFSGSLQVENGDSQTGMKQKQNEKSWVEENFEQFNPIIEKIGTGFQENYLLAREKAKEQKAPVAELSKAALDEIELEWMNDENLREIVFKVRDNELAGKDPFHLMDSDEKIAFFNGLEKKAEKINAKMSALHEYFHSRIENLDYGTDGISIHDPPEKIFPRWKGPPLSEDPEFLNNRSSDSTKEQLSPLKSSSHVQDLRKKSSDGATINPRTVIDSSDGSTRPGKKMGKEHWEHTKKWSREFLQLYNEEADPEIKSIMKDMGKDLDRWITEREIQDVADLMSRIPRRKRKFIEKKMNKLKAEIESYGHQAVFTKYQEYVDEKEEDYLWWLDLSCILCIEMYRVEDEVPKIGFYSLEMAPDLELDPKQHHVIAFEDAGDSKNFCHIMQSHLEMLGNGSAFVVARPPKDAFREAKANGFSVTVIKKGGIKLNVDQTLEEVEEEMIEIGSKVYHDKIMKERGIDMNTLMKGVINADKSLKS